MRAGRESEAVAYHAGMGCIAVRVGEKNGYALAVALTPNEATALRDTLTRLLSEVEGGRAGDAM